jgi:glycosyltransferase involved in cell wall biosynthesis
VVAYDARRGSHYEIVVVIPVFKQAGFLVEAIECATAQITTAKICVIVVNDGCPFEETHVVARGYAMSNPGIIYVHKTNGGLSAARNTGIDLALQLFPEFEGLYLLDADNRIGPHFLQKMLEAMRRAPPEVGWIYPDIDMFGFRQSYSVAGTYSLLNHYLENFCEAGSFIAKRLLKTGVRFDENMKAGFEDWEFWLQCAAKGYRGQHISDTGFQYRRRAESMLVGSERVRDSILSYMRTKHDKSLGATSLLKLAEREAPNFIGFDPLSKSINQFIDPRSRKEAPGGILEVGKQFVDALRRPRANFFPHFCVFVDFRLFDFLELCKIDRFLFWYIQNALAERHFACVWFETASDDRIHFMESAEPAGGRMMETCPLIVGQTGIIREASSDPNPAWIGTIRGDSPQPKVIQIRCIFPNYLADGLNAAIATPVIDHLLVTVADLGSRLRSRSDLGSEWREDARKLRAQAREAFTLKTQCGPVFPHVEKAGIRQVGFILPLLEFGGVEKVVLNYAKVFKQNGCEVHLFITDRPDINATSDILELFSSINFLMDSESTEAGWDNLYFGAGISKHAGGPLSDRLAGLLMTMNVIVNTHSLIAHTVMAALRKHGVRTYVGLHLVELSKSGHPMGNPNTALAYEHAYDGFVVISKQLASWCLARGVPRDKVLVVPNVSSYSCEEIEVANVLQKRMANTNSCVLNILYLGRLDQQKGIDRLRAIAERTSVARFCWRIVGKSVLQDDASILPSGLRIEDAVSSAEALTELYSWADVLVLPSRFEGVPLTIIEAQRLGCVPIATKVGAVEEIIANGDTGFLIQTPSSDRAIVDEFVELLEMLGSNRAVLCKMAKSCIDSQADRTWLDQMHSWITDATK